MAKEDKKTMKVVNEGGPAGMMYCMGILGTAFYFVSQVDGFWNVILAILKAFVWPAFLINRIFELLRI